MPKTQNDRAVIDLVINGQQANTSLKEISLAATNTRSALYKMKETDPGYKDKLKELQALLAAQRQMTANINTTASAWSKFKQQASSVAAGVVGGNVISMGLQAIPGAISAVVEKYRVFDAASKELSAVTGMTGADLEYLNKTAASTGPTFGKSGADMLEAYKLMASAKPELLSQKELLTQTTEAAITLAQAGKIDLAQATQVTAESLNQFGEGADQANRFINVIAAGAKEGSAEIADMGVALKNSGTVAAAQGVSFEQTNAALQSMSTIALKGGEAGTQLRNVLLTLGSGSDATNPKVVGLEKALENLGKKNMSTAEMTKLFGKENITAAQHMITHRNEIAELTKKVSGTQEAFTQAKTNNESLDHQLEVFWARVEGLAIILGTKLVPVFTKVVEGATWLTKVLTGGLTPASEKATQAFNDQNSKVRDLTRNLTPLLDRHDALKKKSVLTKDEQAELKTIIGQVASIVPTAVTEFDKYGKALDVNTEKAQEFIKMQKALLKYTYREGIATTTAELKDKTAERDALVRKMNSKTTTEWVNVDRGGMEVRRKLTDKELKQMQTKVDELNAKIDELNTTKAAMTGEYPKSDSSGKPTATPTTPPKVDGLGGGQGGGLSDEEKKKREAKITANHEAQLAIEKMDMEAIKNEKQREIAKAEFEANQEKERARKSQATAALKAKWIKGIEDRLVVDKLTINEKYADKDKELLEKQQKEVFDHAEKELELKKRMAEYEIELAISSGKITKQQGEEAKLKAEQTYLSAKQLLTEAYYKKQAEQNQQSTTNTEAQNKKAAIRLKQIEIDKQTDLLAIQAQGANNQAKVGELNQDKIEKALKDDLRDIENERQKSLNEIQKKAKAGLLSPTAARNAEIEVEQKFLMARRQIYEDYYSLMARMGNLSAEQIKDIEREKNRALLDMDNQLMQAQQTQYEGKLGNLKKYMDNMDMYIQQGADALKTLFEPNKQILDLSPLLGELDKLQQKTNLSSSEQERMKNIITQIGSVMPNVVTQTNQYGEAIGINTGAVRDEVAAQKSRAKTMHAIMVAQSAWAAAMATVEFGQSIMHIWATAPNPLTAIGFSALATATYLSTLAKIKKETFDAPKFADGGFTNAPGGYVDGPTLFQMGNRRFIAGEAGREFVVSNSALQQPVVANFARMLDVAQKSGNYSMLNTGVSAAASPGTSMGAGMASTGMNQELAMATLRQLQLIQQSLDNYAAKPVVQDYFAWERNKEEVDYIRQATKG
ncbi:phage tail tape measure protein [Spirosoma sp. BT702]|uniref:Phage tail tape measure protein n=1 Tax=Spirosoma profusum TaxID=2771354 RepID=A0A926XYH6_9BACT|nr:phage tail tape measure protein [Spirosoma profusum]MBD2700158.1 phage tail tape measure protein [Spirosoma profusum]